MSDPISLRLAFRAPSLPLSENRSRQMHWAARSRLLHPWRDAAHLAVRQTLGPPPYRPTPFVIVVDLPFRTATRRDPHNYVGTNVKAVVDGLVNAGLLPDDNAKWATIGEPTTSIQRDRTKPMIATVTITPR